MRASPGRSSRDVDLNDFARGDGYLFVRDGVGLAGRGVAARVPLADVAEVLAGIEHDDEVGQPGCGPVALGVLPFRPGAPGRAGRPGGDRRQGRRRHRWITTIDARGRSDLASTWPRRRRRRGGGFTVATRASRSRPTWPR